MRTRYYCSLFAVIGAYAIGKTCGLVGSEPVFTALIAFIGVWMGVDQWRYALKSKALEKIESNLSFLHESLYTMIEIGNPLSVEGHADRFEILMKNLFKGENGQLWSLELHLPDKLLALNEDMREIYLRILVDYQNQTWLNDHTTESGSKVFTFTGNDRQKLEELRSEIVSFKKKIRDEFYSVIPPNKT